MNSAGWIGDRSRAGKTLRQYGTVQDHGRPLYLLTDSDIETLLRWMPGGWRLPTLRGILLVDFHLPATNLPALTWPDIIAMLNTANPAHLCSDTPVARDLAEASGAQAKPDASKPQHADGPQPPKAFWWKGKQVELEPVPWRLLDSLWQAPGHRKKVNDLETAVWGKESESDSRLKTAIQRANKAMTEAACPLAISKSGEWVALK
ncbi:MAG TPA: helix-turn-helix domain-containing protein [Tepidisphaeraceae bacterium]|jgi:hypothetical protein